MNIIVITAGQRPKLIEQTFRSMKENAANWSDHHLTVVMDGCSVVQKLSNAGVDPDTAIINVKAQGASTSRNIGAGSVPKYRRQSHVCFFDDDVFLVKDWDRQLMELSFYESDHIVTGHSHPYNGSEPVMVNMGTSDAPNYLPFREPLVVSTVNMLMPWAMWDDIGPFQEPGGAGGSEDFALCMVAKSKFYGFAITDPQCVIHTGLTSSTGKKIVGWDEMMKQNERLVGKSGEMAVYE